MVCKLWSTNKIHITRNNNFFQEISQLFWFILVHIGCVGCCPFLYAGVPNLCVFILRPRRKTAGPRVPVCLHPWRSRDVGCRSHLSVKHHSPQWHIDALCLSAIIGIKKRGHKGFCGENYVGVWVKEDKGLVISSCATQKLCTVSCTCSRPVYPIMPYYAHGFFTSQVMHFLLAPTVVEGNTWINTSIWNIFGLPDLQSLTTNTID